MQLSYLLMGMFLDDTAMLVIVAPLYIPLVKSLGFDPIWYGVLYTITCQIAYMTPPFGYNLFLMKAMAPKEITLADIYSSIVPFVGIMLVGLVLVMLFPGIAMYLPRQVPVTFKPMERRCERTFLARTAGKARPPALGGRAGRHRGRE